MGIFRKIASVSTLGAIDFRSAKDRTAAYSRGTRTQARKQTKIMAKADRRERKAARQAKALDNAYRTAPRIEATPAPVTPTVAHLDGQMVTRPPWPGWYRLGPGGTPAYWTGGVWVDRNGNPL